MTTHNHGNAIVEKIIALRDKKGAIAPDDMSGILEDVANALSGASEIDAFLRDEIIRIAHHIETTRNEIAALAPASPSDAADTAAVQLDAVLKSTEEAAHAIMDAADEIQDAVKAAALDPAARDAILAITSRIYEACNFQDLTGQRIKKVMRALEFTESRISRLVSLFSMDGTVRIDKLIKAESERPDAHLLNGPQLPDNAPSQEEIDALFGNTK